MDPSPIQGDAEQQHAALENAPNSSAMTESDILPYSQSLPSYKLPGIPNLVQELLNPVWWWSSLGNGLRSEWILFFRSCILMLVNMERSLPVQLRNIFASNLDLSLVAVINQDPTTNCPENIRLFPFKSVMEKLNFLIQGLFIRKSSLVTRVRFNFVSRYTAIKGPYANISQSNTP